MKNLIKKRILKYCFQFLLILVGFLICYEASLLRKQEKTGFPYLDIETEILEEKGRLSEMLTDMNRGLSSYDAKAVALIVTYTNGTLEYTYFGSKEDAYECILGNGFQEGRIKGFFGTSILVSIKSREDEIYHNQNSYVRLVFVSEGNVRKDLPAEAIRSIIGKDPSGWRTDFLKENREDSWKVFLLIFGVILFLEAYQTLYETRESVLVFLLGESSVRIVCEKMILDIAVTLLTGLFGVMMGCNLYLEVVPIDIFLVTAFIYFFADFFLGIGIFTTQWKKNMVSHRESRFLLIVSYILSAGLLLIYLAILGRGTKDIKEFVTASSHDAFYEYFRDWGQVSSNDSDILYTELLPEKETALCYWMDPGEEPISGKKIILINDNTYDYLRKSNSTIPGQDTFGEDLVVLIPSGWKERIWPGQLSGILSEISLFQNGEFEVEEYSGKIDLPLIRGTHTPDGDIWVNDPVLILDRRENLDFYCEYLSDDVDFLLKGSFLVKLPEKSESRYLGITSNGRTYECQSLHDIYEEKMAPYRASMIYWLSIFIVTGIMELLLLLRIVGLEFRMHLMTYLSLRIFGAGFIEIYGGLFGITIALCTGAGFLSLFFFRKDLSIPEWATVYLIVSAVECVVQAIYVLRLEKSSFPKLLKGGIL